MRRFAFITGLFISFGIASAQPTPAQPAQPAPYQPSEQQQFVAQQTAVQPTPAWQYESQISAGYSNVSFNHATGVAYSPGGPYIDGNIALPIPGLVSPIVGLGISASGYFDDQNTAFGTLYSDVSLISVEGRVSFPIPPRSSQGLFIVPRLGVGMLFDNSLVQTPVIGGTVNTYFNGLAFEVRPYIEAGYRIGQASFGVEASYMAAWGSFGRLGDMAQELRIGLAFAYRF